LAKRVFGFGQHRQLLVSTPDVPKGWNKISLDQQNPAMLLDRFLIFARVEMEQAEMVVRVERPRPKLNRFLQGGHRLSKAFLGSEISNRVPVARGWVAWV
jgi:hypothetical protein